VVSPGYNGGPGYSGGLDIKYCFPNTAV